jgi:hypothetical protein
VTGLPGTCHGNRRAGWDFVTEKSGKITPAPIPVVMSGLIDADAKNYSRIVFVAGNLHFRHSHGRNVGQNTIS